MNRDIAKNYEQLLQCGEWNEFANRIKMERAHCERCENPDQDRLEVHHLGYRQNALPWEYEDQEVILLCETCHRQIHETADRLWNAVLKSRNQWVIHECCKAVEEILARHPADRL